MFKVNLFVHGAGRRLDQRSSADGYSQWFLSLSSVASGLEKPLLAVSGRTQNSVLYYFYISAIAETRKSAGNDAFLKGDFVKAINFYTEGIEVKCQDEDLNAKLHNNRASAHYHLGKV